MKTPSSIPQFLAILADKTRAAGLVPIALLSLLAGQGALAAPPLDEAFQNPPEETKPWCYWYWLKNDISKEGVTKDLEAMRKVGIKLAMIGNIEGGGPVKMFSPEWYDITRHALREANRLSIEIMMFNAPGWSQSGGPWITPEQSMRRVTWNEVDAKGGSFSQNIRAQGVPAGQDIAVLAVPRRDAVTITGTPGGAGLSLAASKWIWHPAEDGATNAPEGTRTFQRVIEADPGKLSSAKIMLTADNDYTLSINGTRIASDGEWQTIETISILPHLKPGANTITLAVTNTEAGAAGLIAAIGLTDKAGATRTLVTDKEWTATANAGDPEVAARELGPLNMAPWKLGNTAPGSPLRFSHPEAFTARSLVIHGKGGGKLFAIKHGTRELIADIDAKAGNPKTDFLPDAPETFSFPDATASEFELEGKIDGKAVLGSAPVVARVAGKQMGRMHPTPSPTWESYIFPDSAEPGDASVVIPQNAILNLTDKLGADGVLTCTLPEGAWTVIHFGMIPTGKKNAPAPPEATGLEVDKMSRKHIRHHFNGMFGEMLQQVTPEEKAAWVGITIDSYEVGSQNWTDGFDADFEKRTGYNPILLLPVMTGRLIDSAKASDQFLWDLRRTVADMIAEEYVAGLREIANEHDLRLWCENYGHWGFPGEFTIYGGQSDEIGGEFWTTGDLGNIECRAASSTGHIYGKRRIYVEAFTSGLNLDHHPAVIKARGEEMMCEGVNHFVLHVYAHQTKDGAPGKNPWFGTAFHRNTPWFNQSRDWVKYLQRCHTMLQHGEPAADVAVYIGDFAPQMTGPANPVPTGYDFDYMGSDAILRKLHVVDGEWVVCDEHDPKRISTRWKVLAMPANQHVRPQVLKRLEALKQAGGKVIEGVPVSAATLQSAGIPPMVADPTCPVLWKARRIEGGGMIFFLSNFKSAGTFEATLRVTGMAPELFDPVTGEITRLARYRSVENGTRVTLDIKDPSDSCFLVFREKPSHPSVAEAAVPPAQLGLFFDAKGQLVAESSAPVNATLTLSDGSTRHLVIDDTSQALAIPGPWKTTDKDGQGFTLLQETSFDLPADFGKDQKITLDLGKVAIMAKVTLNGKPHVTLWRAPFTLDVTDALQPGPNHLQILVTSTTTGKPTLGQVALRTSTRIAVK